MSQPSSSLQLTVRAIRCIGVEVPMRFVLGTSRGTITRAPLLLIDLETEDGVTGCSYLWCYFPAAMPAIANILEEVERVAKGRRTAPVDLWSTLAERYSTEQLLDTIFTVGQYHAVAFALNSCGVPLDAGVPGFDATP